MWNLVEFDDSFTALENRVNVVNHATTVSEVEVTLPVPVLGRKVCIKDGYGDAINKRIVVRPNLNESLDQYGNVGFYFKYPFESKTFMSDGVNWFIIWSENQDSSATGILNLGDPNSLGSWRLRTDGDKMYIERSTGGGVWDTKDIISG